MSVTIRRITQDDAESLREAFDSVAKERRFILRVEAPSLEDVQSFILDALRCDLPYTVACNESGIVGFCAITRRKEAGCTHVGQLGMGVVAAYRRQGIGRRLLSSALEYAMRVSMTRVELEVYSSNQAAIRLYESVGFKKEGLRRRARYLDGIWDDITLMALLESKNLPEADRPEDPIIRRIERSSGATGMSAMLESIPPTDLQSLLLRVQRVRAEKRQPSMLLSDYGKSRFVRPAKVRVSRLLEWESLACSRLPGYFEAIDLSPLCPLGTSSVLASVAQDWAVATVRNNEVVSDPTNVLALECAMRRKQILSAEAKGAKPIHLAARHRVLRPQFYSDRKMATHFGIFALCSAGRDLGGRQFEISTLAQHVRFHIDVLRRFLGAKPAIIISLSDFIAKDDNENLAGGLLQPMRDDFENVTCIVDNKRQAGRGYYRDLCCKIYVQVESGEKIEVGDGGSVDWTSKLLSNAKERLVISGLGSERVCEIADSL